MSKPESLWDRIVHVFSPEAPVSGKRLFPPVPGMEKIEHLVILMMENRSFDHFLGALTLDSAYKGKVEGFPTDPSKMPTNPDDSKNPIPSWCMDAETYGYVDPPHGPGPQTANYNGGKLDGFVTNYQTEVANQEKIQGKPLANNPKGQAKNPMGYYTRGVLPVLYSLADNFAVCDHWFSSMLSSTWPNRKYLHSGVRDGDDDTHTLPEWPGFGTDPIWNVLEDTIDDNGNKYTWKCYFSDLPFLAFWYKFAAFHALSNFTSIDNFANDCREDNLPTVSIIDPPFSLADDHPSHDVQLGEKFIGLVVDALTHSESWEKTALIITYDENGGFFDHVAPPPPFNADSEDTPLGFRVPSLVISPYTPAGVCSTVFDHTSIMKSIAVRWNIDFSDPKFGTRWMKAPDIWSSNCFDFTMAPRAMGVYTEQKGAGPAFAHLTWEGGTHELMASPLGDLHALMERVLVLPELKLLDRRSGVFNALNGFETNVRNIKRTLVPEKKDSETSSPS